MSHCWLIFISGQIRLWLKVSVEQFRSVCLTETSLLFTFVLEFLFGKCFAFILAQRTSRNHRLRFLLPFSIVNKKKIKKMKPLQNFCRTGSGGKRKPRLSSNATGRSETGGKPPFLRSSTKAAFIVTLQTKTVVSITWSEVTPPKKNQTNTCC